MDIGIYLTVSQIGELDEQRQSFSTSGWFTFQWVDDSLKWNVTDFNGTEQIYLSSQTIWTPDLVLLNSATGIKLFSHQQVPVSVEHTGLVVWYHGDLFQSQCDFDIVHFPFDTQICNFVLSTWVTTSDKVKLTPLPHQLDIYTTGENGLWQLRNITTFLKEHQYPRLIVELTLKRRPSYYVYNLIIPITLLSLLSSLVFALPMEYGDKVALSMTVLLSFGVFLTQMTTNMPKTSRQTSYLTIYLTALLTLSSLSVAMMILILRIYKRQGKVPKVLQKWVVLWKCFSSNKKQTAAVDQDHADDVSTEDPSWKDVSATLEAMCLRLFLFMNISLGIVLFTVLIVLTN
ncbi:acetylcholine receptor subunit alpha-like [Haliotis rufescens]|uniref:acetylcholine receptor subunit alpha-like n=1 Tax=Haliotis rufescens TaxID=6454 RepID=UPI00201E99C4|nr:acetylcholine receptor subunit alpha-like [Haliotis rufescens]